MNINQPELEKRVRKTFKVVQAMHFNWYERPVIHAHLSGYSFDPPPTDYSKPIFTEIPTVTFTVENRTGVNFIYATVPLIDANFKLLVGRLLR